MPASLLEHERAARLGGVSFLAGVDEAGRGPLAGPVVAAAVCFPPGDPWTSIPKALRGLTDSKRLSQGQRERFFAVLTEWPGIAIGVGEADAPEIDRLDILRATHAVMARALSALPCLPQLALVDGLPVPGLPCPHLNLIGGDGRSLSIAAASVIAKVTRDARLMELDARYPAYGFARHKGYGTRAHLEALDRWGPCPAHRHSFRPVHEAAARQPRDA
jgi:ribonuclease HII